MMTPYRPLTFIRAFLAAAFLAVLAQSGISAGLSKCAECGMLVDAAAPFSSKIVEKEHTLYFCDIGDLLAYLRNKKLGPDNAWVKDYRSGDWIDASKAFYVHESMRFITPMGWGVATFRNRKDAAEFGEPSDIATITKRLK